MKWQGLRRKVRCWIEVLIAAGGEVLEKTFPAALSISAHSLGWPQENESDWIKFLYAAAGGVSEETFPAALSILGHTLAKAKEKRLTAQRFSSQRVAKFRKKLSRLH